MVTLAARALFAAGSIALCLAAVLLAASGVVERQSFKAFYCAGTAVRHGQDPYRVEPLRSCERAILPSMPRGYVEPAPLPGYALALFALLSALPLKAAAMLFALGLALAAIAAAYATGTIARAPPFAVLLAFTPLALLNIAYGETPPLGVVAICAAALFLYKERWIAAAIAVSCALLQPNIGAVAAVSVLLFAPRTRITLLACFVVLAIVSFVAIGPAANVEYFKGVLPAQAQAELVATDQYSLARQLFAAGVASNTALSIAKISFAIMAVVGIALAGVATRRTGNRGFLPLLPAAAALLGGLYVHDIQMLFAVPAAVLVAVYVPDRAYRALGATALALLAVVWSERIGRAVLALDLAAVTGGVYAVARGPASRRVLTGVVAAFAIILCAVVLQKISPPTSTAPIVTAQFDSAPDDLAPNAWAEYLRRSPHLTRGAFVLKLPTWVGLGVLLLCALHLCRAKGAVTDVGESTPSRSELREPPLATES